MGYTVDPSILSLIGNEQLISIVLKGVTILLILHPIAAGLSLATLIPILLSCCCGHHAAWILSLIASIVTAIVSSVVLAADLALVIIARNKVKDLALGTFDVKFGNGVWMMVAGVALIWLCVILLSARACYCCGFRRYVTCIRPSKSLYSKGFIGNTITGTSAALQTHAWCYDYLRNLLLSYLDSRCIPCTSFATTADERVCGIFQVCLSQGCCQLQKTLLTRDICGLRYCRKLPKKIFTNYRTEYKTTQSCKSREKQNVTIRISEYRIRLSIQGTITAQS